MVISLSWTPGTTAPLNGLWKANYKINTDQSGFNFSLWVAPKDAAGARTVFEDIGKRIIQLLPQDAEVIEATAYCMDGQRNSMALRNSTGQGNWGNLQTTPVVTVCDNSHSAVKIRIEDADYGVYSRKFNVLPDDVSAADEIIGGVTAVIGMPAALPALPVSGDSYTTQFNAFLQAIVFQCVHVQKGWVPGGAYNYKPFLNAYVKSLGVKKGARVFIS